MCQVTLNFIALIVVCPNSSRFITSLNYYSNFVRPISIFYCFSYCKCEEKIWKVNGKKSLLVYERIDRILLLHQNENKNNHILPNEIFFKEIDDKNDTKKNGKYSIQMNIPNFQLIFLSKPYWLHTSNSIKFLALHQSTYSVP